jgi:hypothetical protein
VLPKPEELNAYLTGQPFRMTLKSSATAKPSLHKLRGPHSFCGEVRHRANLRVMQIAAYRSDLSALLGETPAAPHSPSATLRRRPCRDS